MSTEHAGRDRRKFVKAAAAGAALAAAGTLLPRLAAAQDPRIKIGLMLPYTGTYAQLGVAITNGIKLAVAQRGGRLAGREVEFYTVDDESNPAKAPENFNRLVQRDQVDLVIGPVHSGVLMGMVKVARDTGTLLICPNAGADEATGVLCAPNVFRTSFSNWQITYPLGAVMKERGHGSAVFLTWKYAAGEQMMKGFKDGFEKAGGKLVKELYLPFPQVEFQPLLTEIAALKADAVACFFAGGAAAKFLKDYAAAGLKGKIPLYGPGFLTDGVLDAVGDAAEGIETTLHYADGLNTPRDNSFRLAYAKTFKLQPDVYAVQGYDAGLLLAAGLEAVKGDVRQREGMIKAMEKARIDSPRGPWSLSAAHNPVQDFYLRKVVGKENRLVRVVQKALADPARGCRMA